jgi:protocatechuate 3,4-dioxygenase beta subunit
MNPLRGAALFAVVIISGHVYDRTTGQGLPHVVVEIGGGKATTDAKGRFSIRNAKLGRSTITVKSDDVPTQHFATNLTTRSAHIDLNVCSTTLDYNCGTPALHDSSGGGSAG